MNDNDLILTRLQQARSHSKDWHKQITRWRKLYDMQHYGGGRKPNEPQYSDPTFTNTVDLAIGMLLANEMIWRAFGWKPTGGEERQSSKIEKFLAGTLEVNNERNEYLIPYEVLMHFLRDGAAVIYSVWDRDIARDTKMIMDMPDPQSEQGVIQRIVYGECPLRVQVIDPLSIFVMPGGPKRWLAIARIEKMSVLDAETMYGVRVPEYAHLSEMERAETKGEFTDYWDYANVVEVNQESGESYTRQVVRNAVLFEGAILRPLRVMDGYDDLPYTIDFCKPVGRASSDKWGHSILAPLEEPIAFLEKAINRRQFQIDLYTALPLTVKAPAGRKFDFDPALGNVTHIHPDEDVQFPQWQGNPPDVAQQIDFLRSRVQQSGFSDVMYGALGQVAGYAMSQIGDQNRIRLEQPIAHLKMLWTRWAKKALRLIDEFSPDAMIRVYGRMRGLDFVDFVLGEDADKFMVKCIIRPEFPNEKVRKHAMASQVRGILSNHRIMEDYLDVEQPDDERQRMLVEQMQAHPIAINYALVAELKRLVEEESDPIAQMVLTQMQQGGLAGEPGRPTAPPNPAQPLGLQSATGEAQPQVPFGQDAGAQMSNMANAAPGLDGSI